MTALRWEGVAGAGSCEPGEGGLRARGAQCPPRLPVPWCPDAQLCFREGQAAPVSGSAGWDGPVRVGGAPSRVLLGAERPSVGRAGWRAVLCCAILCLRSLSCPPGLLVPREELSASKTGTSQGRRCPSSPPQSARALEAPRPMGAPLGWRVALPCTAGGTRFLATKAAPGLVACFEAPLSSCRKRVTSQRCSLEFLEDAVGCAPAQRYTPPSAPSSTTPLGLPLTPAGPEGPGRKRVTCVLCLAEPNTHLDHRDIKA